MSVKIGPILLLHDIFFNNKFNEIFSIAESSSYITKKGKKLPDFSDKFFMVFLWIMCKLYT